MSREATDAAIVRAVLDAWIDGKPGLAADEIAEAIDRSVGMVRRAIAAHHGAVRGTQALRGERATYSRNYPSMQAGVVRVWLYRPDDDTIRRCIRDLRARVSTCSGCGDAEHAGTTCACGCTGPL